MAQQAEITPELEKEIRDMCYLAIRGRPVNISIQRIAWLHHAFLEDYERIHAEEKARAIREINPLWDR